MCPENETHKKLATNLRTMKTMSAAQSAAKEPERLAQTNSGISVVEETTAIFPVAEEATNGHVFCFNESTSSRLRDA